MALSIAADLAVLVNNRNEADTLSFRATKALNEYREKLPKDIVDDVQAKIDALKKAIDSNDISRIKSAKGELETHMQHIGEAMAKAGAPGASPEGMGSAGGSHDNGDQFSGSGNFGGGHAEHGSHHGSKSDDDDIEEADVEIIDPEKK